MTPERAAYHRLMLLAGIQEDYQRELDLALETEDPITAPLLDLAFCMSDRNQTVSVLYNYTLDFVVDQQQVYDMMMKKLRCLFVSKQLPATRICEALSTIQSVCDFEEPWLELYRYLYEYELYFDGIISRDVFEISFEATFLRGEQINIWALQEEMHPKKKKSILDFFRKRTRKEKSQ